MDNIRVRIKSNHDWITVYQRVVENNILGFTRNIIVFDVPSREKYTGNKNKDTLEIFDDGGFEKISEVEVYCSDDGKRLIEY